MKMHVVAFKKTKALPIPEYLGLGGADEHDLNMLKYLAHDLHDAKIYADKACCDSWVESLLKQRDANLVTPIKRKKGDPPLTLFQKIFCAEVSRVRQPIESLFSWIERKTGIQNASRVRSTKGLLTHIFGRMVAVFMLLLANF